MLTLSYLISEEHLTFVISVLFSKIFVVIIFIQYIYSISLDWRKEEMERINTTLSGADRKAALCALLEQETMYIASIESHHRAAREKTQGKAVQAFLNKVPTFSMY